MSGLKACPTCGTGDMFHAHAVLNPKPQSWRALTALRSATTVLVRQARDGADQFVHGLLWAHEGAFYAVTEEQPCGTQAYGSLAEVLVDWDQFWEIPT